MELQKTKQNQNRTKASATFTSLLLLIVKFLSHPLRCIATSVRQRSQGWGLCLVQHNPASGVRPDIVLLIASFSQRYVRSIDMCGRAPIN